jgi:AraC-like DNA-binding protein
VKVQRHSSELSSWEMVSADPAPWLRGSVQRYCGYVERSSGPMRRRQVASPEVTLIISLGPAIDVTMDPAAAGSRAERVTSFVAGLSDVPAVTEYSGEQCGIEVNLTPIAARRLLGVPMSELANRVVGLEDVLGHGAAELVERLAGTPGWQARFALLDAVLAARLDGRARPPAEVVGAWARLTAAYGEVPVAALAEATGWSRRHLARRFHEHVGLSPKVLARVLRFERVVGLLGRDDGTRFAEIAYACGYSDQAHLNREFRAFAGDTPSGYLARRLPDGGGVEA